MKIDVFVSYHTESSHNIVKAIVDKLESNHVHCWYAPRDVDVGAYAKSILQAIKACSVYLLILNKPASESVHVLNELNAATSRLAHKEPISILPFHVENTRNDISVDAHYYIGRIHWIDGITPPLEQRINELTERIMLILGKSTAEEALEEKNQYRIIQKLPQIRDVFYGRQALIDKIHSIFQSGNRIICLEGMGGIGKSELAKQYAVHCGASYDTIVFSPYINGIKSMVCDPQTIEIEGLHRYPDESEDAFFQRKLHIFRSISNERTLLILDNFDVDFDSDLDTLLEGEHRVIITSRNTHAGNMTIRVDAITDQETILRIFEENFGSDIDNEDIDSLLELFKLVEYHTYTIELLAKQMQASYLSGEEMLELFQNGQMKDGLTETVVGRRERKTAFGHIRTIFSTSNLSPEEKQILRILSLTGTHGIVARWLKEWASLNSFEDVNRLVEKSWIRREHGKRFSLHPLVVEVVQADLHPDTSNCHDFIDHAGTFAIQAWRRPAKENIQVRESVLSILDYFSPFDMRLWYDFEPLIGYLWQVAKFDESIRHMNTLYQTALSTYGSANMVTGLIARAVGGCYYNSRRLKESIPWYKLALQCMLDSHSPHNQDIASAYEKVGRCYTWEYDRNLGKAEEYLNKALAMRIEIRDAYLRGDIICETHPAGDNSLREVSQAIGGAYMELGRMKQVAGNYRDALKYATLCKENYLTYNTHSPSSIAFAYYDIGVCHYHIGKDEESAGNHDVAIQEWKSAETYLLQALEINMRMRAGLAFDTIGNQEYLGDVYVALGQLGEAKVAYSDAISMLEKIVGKDSPDIQRIMHKIGLI